MSLPQKLVYPSIWMQKSFFQAAEQSRGTIIGSISQNNGDLKVRSLAFVHGVFQGSYATTMTVPLLCGAIVRDVTSVEDAAREGSFLDNSKRTSLLALCALWMPVVSSFSCVLHPHMLDRMRESVDPVVAHLLFFTDSLPSFSQFRSERRSEIVSLLAQSALRGVISQAVVSRRIPGAERVLPSLQSAADPFDYRTRIAYGLFQRMQNNGIANYDRSLDMRSQDFSVASSAALSISTFLR